MTKHRVGLVGLAAGLLWAGAAWAVTVEVDVESQGDPVSEARVSFETPDGEPITLAEPEPPEQDLPVAEAEPVEAEVPVAEAEPAQPQSPMGESELVEVEPDPEPRMPVTVVTTGEMGTARLEIDDRFKDRTVIAVVEHEGRTVRVPVALTEDVVQVSIDITPPAVAPEVPQAAPAPRPTPEAPPALVSVPEPVVPPAPVPPIASELFLGGFAGALDAPGLPFLATETELEGLVLGAVKFDPEADVAGVQAGGRILLPPVSGALRPFVMARFNRFDGDDSAALGTLDPMGGLLGIPGTGDPTAMFPAGIALPGGIASDLRADFEQEGMGVGGAVGLAVPLGELAFSPFIGLSFSEIDQHTSFAGMVEAFDIEFEYTTDLAIERFSVDLGAILDVPLAPLGSPLALSAYLQPVLHFDMTSVSGRDRLRLSGLVSDLQAVKLDEDSTDIGVSVSGGLRWSPAAVPFIIDLGATVTHRPGAVVVRRSGETGERSQANIDDVTVIVGSLRTTFRF